MPFESYPRPPPFTWPPVPCRSLLPIYPPPQPLQLPPLPSPPRQPAFTATFSLSTHVFPATYLRTTPPRVPVPAPPPPNASKPDRLKHYLDTRHQLKALRGSTVTDGFPQVLWNCVNRYTSTHRNPKSPARLTLFLAHANGFPKEIWEPMLGHLLSSPAGESIQEVWTWESVQHGDAALINAKELSGVFDWIDNTRDILNFLFHYIPSEASNAPLPTHLQRVPTEESEYRRANGFRNRQLIAIGHSYGGCTSALAAIFHPKLFSSLVLVDPVIVIPKEQSDGQMNEHVGRLVLGALSRRDTWSSRQEALEVFNKSPFFKAWDPAVLQVYLECGLYLTRDESGNDVAKLKMPGIQEAVVFSETHTELQAFHQLANLDDRVTLHWVVPGKPGAGEFGPPGSTQQRVWVRPTNVSNVRIPGAGHLIAQEQPRLLAQDLGDFILQHYAMLPRASL